MERGIRVNATLREGASIRGTESCAYSIRWLDADLNL